MAEGEWRADAERNTKRLGGAVRDLAAELDAKNYRQFWERVKNVQALFKDLKPTVREEREHLWLEFGSLCEQAKRQQEREREKRASTSRNKRELVESKLNQAYHEARSSHSESELRAAEDVLELAKEWMKDGYSSGFTGTTEFFAAVLSDDGIMTKADADACWKRFKEVKETIHWHRKKFRDFNYEQFSRDASDAGSLAENSPKEAREKVQEIQRAMKGRTLEPWQFEKIRSALDDVYKSANNSSGRRRAEWERKMRASKSQTFELMEKQQNIIAKIEGEIDRCRDMLSEARSSEHQGRVQGWIDEKLDKIRDIERFIHKLEGQISDIDSRLSE
jgi:hypothetical protein